ncbi:hypothetical protein D3450_25050 [Salmonella enterica]|nr:hypothetical protein [Salmonella enterica]
MQHIIMCLMTASKTILCFLRNMIRFICRLSVVSLDEPQMTTPEVAARGCSHEKAPRIGGDRTNDGNIVILFNFYVLLAFIPV